MGRVGGSLFRTRRYRRGYGKKLLSTFSLDNTPIIEEAAAEIQGAKIGKVDVDEQAELARQGIPIQDKTLQERIWQKALIHIFSGQIHGNNKKSCVRASPGEFYHIGNEASYRKYWKRTFR